MKVLLGIYSMGSLRQCRRKGDTWGETVVRVRILYEGKVSVYQHSIYLCYI